MVCSRSASPMRMSSRSITVASLSPGRVNASLLVRVAVGQDLVELAPGLNQSLTRFLDLCVAPGVENLHHREGGLPGGVPQIGGVVVDVRSEERRVGKEGRTRRTP